MPYRDFWWFYPPGQPYLLGGLWALFGPSLLTWRIVRVLTDATVAVLAYFLALRAAPPRLALITWFAMRLAMAFPSGPHPFPIAIACVLGALLLFERRPVLAGVLVGVCAAWRLEFALYAAAGMLLSDAIRPGSVRRRLRLGARFALPALVVGAALYAPVVIAAGFSRSWHLIVSYPATTFSKYQSLPFPLHYKGPLNTSGVPGFFTDSAENLLHFYLPLALVVGLVATLLALALRSARSAWWQLATAVFACGMAHYLLDPPRPLPHRAARGDAVDPRRLGAGRAAAVQRIRPAQLAVTAVVALALVWVVADGLDRRVRGVQDHGVAINLPVADGARDRARQACRPLERAVHFVDSAVPRGQPIYVTTLRSDLVTSGDPLFYVLADRPNPTRYDIPAPGVVTSAPVQREIIGDLERARPRMVVRFAAPITAAPEPDRGGTVERGAPARPVPGCELPPGGQVRLLRDPRQERLMRLAYVLERYPELSQTFVEDELRELERAGDGVEVLALEPGSRPELSDAHFKPAYPPRGTERLAALAELAARSPARVGGYLAHPQPWPSDGRRARGIARVAAWVGRARRSDHIHAHFATEAADVAALLGRLSGRPHSFTGHSTDLFADPPACAAGWGTRRSPCSSVTTTAARWSGWPRAPAASRWCRSAWTSSGSPAARRTTPTGRWWPSRGWWSTRV